MTIIAMNLLRRKGERKEDMLHVFHIKNNNNNKLGNKLCKAIKKEQRNQKLKAAYDNFMQFASTQFRQTTSSDSYRQSKSLGVSSSQFDYLRSKRCIFIELE